MDGYGENDLGVDIGLEAAVPTVTSAASLPEPRIARPNRPSGKRLAALAAAVVGLIVVVGLMLGPGGGNERARSDPAGSADPAGPADLGDADRVGSPDLGDGVDPAVPLPAGGAAEGTLPTVDEASEAADVLGAPPVEVPVVRGDIVRAGERCIFDLGASVVSFVVPDGLSAKCGEVTEFWTDPMSARTGRDALPVAVSVGVGRVLRDHWELMSEPAPDRIRPLLGASGYRRWEYRYDAISNTTLADENGWPPLDGLIIEAPGGTLDVTKIDMATIDMAKMGSSWAISPIGSERQAWAYEQLVASIKIDLAESEPMPMRDAGQAMTPGGWCTGDRWTTRIPGNWFGGPECEWVAAWFDPTDLALGIVSTEPTACECDPPIWVDTRGPGAIDGDFGFTEIVSEITTTHRSGYPLRTVEGQMPGALDGERREAVVSVVETDDEQIIVGAIDDSSFLLPGQSWEDVLAAHRRMVDGIRFHSGPDCGEPGVQWRAAGTKKAPFLDLLIVQDYIAMPIPSGTALIGTGCVRPESREVEVRLGDDPSIVGWVAERLLGQPEVGACEALDPGLGIEEWDLGAVGDFDGDGRADNAYVSSVGVGVAVVFANGGGLLFDSGPNPTGSNLTPLRILGMGHDLLEYRRGLDDRDELVGWLDFGNCRAVEVRTFPIDGSPQERYGYCVVSLPGRGDVVRQWDERLGPQSRGDDSGAGEVVEYVYANSLIEAADGELRDTGIVGTDGPCGPTIGGWRGLVERVQLSQGAIVADQRAGVHEITLQWISAAGAGAGSVTFDEVVPGVYEVDGSHRAPPGDELAMTGFLTFSSDDEIVFDGTITTTVTQLNRGEACVRSSGQRFIRVAGTSTFRMQDRINCDGARTDWIDITIAE